MLPDAETSKARAFGMTPRTRHPRHVGDVPLQHAAVASIAPRWPGGPAVLLTTFAAVGRGTIMALPNASAAAIFASTHTPGMS